LTETVPLEFTSIDPPFTSPLVPKFNVPREFTVTVVPTVSVAPTESPTVTVFTADWPPIVSELQTADPLSRLTVAPIANEIVTSSLAVGTVAGDQFEGVNQSVPGPTQLTEFALATEDIMIRQTIIPVERRIISLRMNTLWRKADSIHS
jgi:hypothetical protein